MQYSILITGCSTGIGLEAARMLQERDFLVVASCRKQEDVAALKAQGMKHVVQLDLADSASIAKGLEETLAITHGQLFALFNNGAYGQPGAVEDLPVDVLKAQFESNFFGTHELTTKVLKVMLAQGYGRIVNNSSVLGLVAAPFRGAYNASKFALEGLTDTLRLELADTPIKISLIEPGPIESRFRANALLALQNNIDMENSRHQQGYAEAIERLSKEGVTSSQTLPASAVVKKLIHALESTRPRARYYVTWPTYGAVLMKRLLPTCWLDWVMRRQGA
ncbi:SDR family NAD(P)-dependent oxidoreductase [Marinomonas sp. M1K-6]|uniref:SDR family NAD(P)-dependent oxidoreductase n=1 Tax=Marinomonas profundi TaxID=2726122 RepID=A0A847RCH3_9GAMM|nr:SDR family NAD(P)-dependent oxidoreductase [Marinomonas profundi]NLQ18724.1 SDR family NAD(P)-dependent oxidoreductase [Marinomonas profundi]UDV04030.1 SDR family NAD(P)-dependent oxidoreductase [Marinomonas profundi]